MGELDIEKAAKFLPLQEILDEVKRIGKR